ncbi:GNAT family N-acetyltransferase [Draconibacterium halophilum]|uniref:GNAT family N-acetyltransferase n=1 Tax=Draconibacterium halophilum TaxID=2706887 RepID=A0A6C0REI9_9BACT|nr:GNAT family N-acetyltransferase [Draconibacterium halophilum]QIA08487.1 GNAT family N-acetyltransferase [Draconibacterium halophilum]
MNLKFRKIKESDISFLKRVYRSTRETELDTTGWDEEQKNKFIDFQFNAQDSHYKNAYVGAEFLIIQKNKLDIGRLYLWRTEHQIRIMDIAILPEYRGKGVGTIILNQLIEESEKSLKKLNIHVEYYNPAMRLYERLGFRKTDDTGVYYFMERSAQIKP